MRPPLGAGVIPWLLPADLISCIFLAPMARKLLFSPLSF